MGDELPRGSVACPECVVLAGSRCRSPGGRARATVHAARWRAYYLHARSERALRREHAAHAARFEREGVAA